MIKLDWLKSVTEGITDLTVDQTGLVEIEASTPDGDYEVSITDVQSGWKYTETFTVATLSDARLKENVKPVNTLEGIEFVTFDWNELAEKDFGRKGDSFGVIAQQVQKVLPEAVHEKDGYLHVNYTKVLEHVKVSSLDEVLS